VPVVAWQKLVFGHEMLVPKVERLVADDHVPLLYVYTFPGKSVAAQNEV
jgi:hypothetical protein